MNNSSSHSSLLTTYTVTTPRGTRKLFWHPPGAHARALAYMAKHPGCSIKKTIKPVLFLSFFRHPERR